MGTHRNTALRRDFMSGRRTIMNPMLNSATREFVSVWKSISAFTFNLSRTLISVLAFSSPRTFSLVGGRGSWVARSVMVLPKWNSCTIEGGADVLKRNLCSNQ